MLNYGVVTTFNAEPQQPPLDRASKEALAALPVDIGAGLSALSDETLAATRELYDNPMEGHLSEHVVHVDHVVPDSGGVKVRLYRKVSGPGYRADAHSPALVWIHGGGLVLGAYDRSDPLLYDWADQLNIVCASVEYRLAPEHPYPAAIDDCAAALSWLHTNANTFGVDANRIIVGGNSAGGGLAAALALRARDENGPPVAGQLLLYPMIDDRQQSVSSQWPDPVWPPAANSYGWSAYLGDAKGGPDVSAYAAAARADDLRGLPPTIIVVGSAEGFSDEDIDYANRLRHAGVELELHVYPGAPHGFFTLLRQTPLAQRCHRDVREWLETQTSR